MEPKTRTSLYKSESVSDVVGMVTVSELLTILRRHRFDSQRNTKISDLINQDELPPLNPSDLQEILSTFTFDNGKLHALHELVPALTSISTDEIVGILSVFSFDHARRQALDRLLKYQPSVSDDAKWKLVKAFVHDSSRTDVGQMLGLVMDGNEDAPLDERILGGKVVFEIFDQTYTLADVKQGHGTLEVTHGTRTAIIQLKGTAWVIKTLEQDTMVGSMTLQDYRGRAIVVDKDGYIYLQ